MKIEDVRALAEVLTETDLSLLEYKDGETSIRLERTSGFVPVAKCEPAVPAPQEVTEQENDFNNMHELKAPMVGVFYSAPSPEAEPFVKVGDFVEKGQVVCILEAMKLMNDITAPVSGRIVDICAQNGAVMEYGQTIMKII